MLAMWRKISIVLITACSVTSVGQQPTANIEAGTVNENHYRSSFFRFEYEFPKAWMYLSQDKVNVGNEEAYRQAVDKSLKQNGSDRTTVSGNTTTTRKTEVSTPVDLLIASPAAITSSASDAAPRVRIWADHRNAILDKAGDHAKTIATMGKVIVRPTEITLNGHKFVRVDVVHKDGLYHSNVETVCGDYIVGFDFYASTEKDLHTLTETINTVRFE